MIFMALLLGCASSQNKKEDPATTETGRALFHNHVQHIGGEAALQAHKNLTLRGRIRIMDDPIERRFVLVKQNPNRLLTKIQNPNGHTLEVGFDGTLGWERINGETKEIEPSRMSLLHRQADFFFELHHAKWYPEIHDIKEEMYSSRPCHVVFTTNHLGEKEEIYFDQVSGLKVGTARHPNEESTTIWTRYGHYVSMDDIQIPLSTEEIRGEINHKIVFIEEGTWDNAINTIQLPTELMGK